MGLCTPYKDTKGYYLKKETEKKTDVKKNFVKLVKSLNWFITWIVQGVNLPNELDLEIKKDI